MYFLNNVEIVKRQKLPSDSKKDRSPAKKEVLQVTKLGSEEDKKKKCCNSWFIFMSLILSILILLISILIKSIWRAFRASRITHPLASRSLITSHECLSGNFGNFPSQCSIATTVLWSWHFRSYDGQDASCLIRRCLQFFVDSIKLSREGSSDICILSIESFLKSFFGLSKSLCLSFVGFYIGGEVI